MAADDRLSKELGNEHDSLFGMVGALSDRSDAPNQGKKDDGGSQAMIAALAKIVNEAQVHKLYLMDMEEEDSITTYLKIKNGVSYSIQKETPFEKVIEYTGEGEHTKEVRYKRIIEYTSLDSVKLLKSLTRETLLSTIPSVMGFTVINQYFPDTCETLKEEYKKAINWIDPTTNDPTKPRKRNSKKKAAKK